MQPLHIHPFPPHPNPTPPPPRPRAPLLGGSRVLASWKWAWTAQSGDPGGGLTRSGPGVSRPCARRQPPRKGAGSAEGAASRRPRFRGSAWDQRAPARSIHCHRPQARSAFLRSFVHSPNVLPEPTRMDPPVLVPGGSGEDGEGRAWGTQPREEAHGWRSVCLEKRLPGPWAQEGLSRRHSSLPALPAPSSGSRFPPVTLFLRDLSELEDQARLTAAAVIRQQY